MDSSVGEQTSTKRSSENNATFSQGMVKKLKSLIAFFTMSKEDLVNAGIDTSDQHVAYDQNNAESESNKPEVSRQFGRIL